MPNTLRKHTRVLLTDGRKGTIVGVKPHAYLVSIDKEDLTKYPTLGIAEISREGYGTQIEKVL